MDFIRKKKPHGAPCSDGCESVLSHNSCVDSSGVVQCLTLQNFQSHKETKLGFHPRVNVIIGSSDSGKSAILRAIKWVLFNKPGGESFCSFWGGETFSCIEINGHEIKRSRGKENAYFLDGEKYVAFGAGTVSAIEKAHEVCSVNIQEQLDAPYLLSLSAGEVAKTLNKAVDLDCIDSVSSYLRSSLSGNHTKTEATKESILSLKEELQTFSVLKQAEPLLEKARAYEHKLLLLLNRVNALTLLVSKLTMQPNWTAKQKELQTIEKLLRAVEEKQKQLVDLQIKTQKIRRAGKACFEQQEKNKQHKKEMERMEALFHKYMPEVCPLCEQKIRKAL